jgi:hypothetical protein
VWVGEWVASFRGTTEPFDDATMMALRIGGNNTA